MTAYCWTVPIGARRWHVSSDGHRYECGAWSEMRHKGNAQLQNVRWPDLPVLACATCVGILARRHKASDRRREFDNENRVGF